MKRFLATIVWLPLVAVVLCMAVLSAAMVSATALLIPFVTWLARIGDGD